MNKRVIFTAAVLGLAGLAALFRSSQGPRSPAPMSFDLARSSDAPSSDASPSGWRRRDLALAGERSRENSRVVVYVAGEVNRPGVYTLPRGSRADAAVRAAGGMRSGADPLAVNLAEPLEDGEEVAVPALGEAAAVQSGERRTRHATRGRHHRSSGAAGGRRRRHKAPDDLVDLNTADAATLETLPGIGPTLAERIVEFREANGPFASLDDLLDVAGTSPKMVDELQPYALIGSR